MCVRCGMCGQLNHNQQQPVVGLVQTLDALPVTSAPGSSSSSLGSPRQSCSSSLQAFASPQPQSYYLAPGVAELFPHLTLPARAARLEFLRQFPFLERFNLATRDTPFVIDDLRYVIAFARLQSAQPPRAVYVSILMTPEVHVCAVALMRVVRVRVRGTGSRWRSRAHGRTSRGA